MVILRSRAMAGQSTPDRGPIPIGRGRSRDTETARGVYSSALATATTATVRGASMNEVSRILSDLARGDAHAAGQLLPLVYDELRRLAAVQLAHERPGQTL